MGLQTIWHSWAHTHTHTHTHIGGTKGRSFVVSWVSQKNLVKISKTSVEFWSRTFFFFFNKSRQRNWDSVEEFLRFFFLLYQEGRHCFSHHRKKKGLDYQKGLYESWTIKKEECWKIEAFKLWWWRRLLSVLWTAWRSNQSVLMEINTENTLETLMLKLKLQIFSHLMPIAHSLENTLILGKIAG